ncbi:MAG: BlaI/MecI/CopY family transcriptional regulator [Planctomycetales bacterium]|nr:BlaI/MecI/CopY family transcriptional regulator [Planctomycetales bacterium]
MSERPPLSKGEMEVARTLWEIGPAGVREVHEALLQHREIDFATVQTYLRRLETKGYATSKLKGRVRIYAAKARPKTVIRDTVDDLVDKLFAGETMPLVRHLIEERGIDEDGIKELRELIDRLERGQEEKPSSESTQRGRQGKQGKQGRGKR